MVDGAKHRDGLSDDLADRDAAVRLPVFHLLPDLLAHSQTARQQCKRPATECSGPFRCERSLRSGLPSPPFPKGQSKGAKLQARERGSILSVSSWPGSSRPSTSWQIERKAWMPGSSPGMTSLWDDSSRAENPRFESRPCRAELAARSPLVAEFAGGGWQCAEVRRRYRFRFAVESAALRSWPAALPPPERGRAGEGVRRSARGSSELRNPNPVAEIPLNPQMNLHRAGCPWSMIQFSLMET